MARHTLTPTMQEVGTCQPICALLTRQQ